MPDSNYRGNKNTPHTSGSDVPTGRRRDDRAQSSDSRTESQKAHPRSTAGARTGGCSGHEARPGEALTDQSVNGSDLALDASTDDEDPCLHLNQRRYARIGYQRGAVIERRCTDCGQRIWMEGYQ